MMQFLSVIFPLLFTNNLVLSLVKYLAGEVATKAWLRAILAILSIAGIIATSAISGTPVDFDSLTSIGQLAAESLILAFGSHFSYKAIKLA